MAILLAAALSLSALIGCATEQYVKDQIAAVDTEIRQVRKNVVANQTQIASLKKSAAKQDRLIQKQSTTVREAMSRAEEAHKLAEGKLLYEATISGESVQFGFDTSSLSDEAKTCLDVFSGVVKTDNKNVYIEIQGHTDNIGSEEHNLKLGQARAEDVMRYLHVEQGIPLHRMNAFSYGESKPVAENDTPGNRAKNRRVTIVVME
jgi:outer membrane protein OmpA-like peptidoglycan-associated protein